MKEPYREPFRTRRRVPASAAPAAPATNRIHHQPWLPCHRRALPTGARGADPPPAASSYSSLSPSSPPPPPSPLAAPSPTTRSGRRRTPATPTSRMDCGDGRASRRRRRRRTACCAASRRSAMISYMAATRLRKGSWTISVATSTSTACTSLPLVKTWMVSRDPSVIHEVQGSKSRVLRTCCKL